MQVRALRQPVLGNWLVERQVREVDFQVRTETEAPTSGWIISCRRCTLASACPGGADDHRHARQDAQALRLAAVLAEAALEIGVARLGALRARIAGEDDLSRARGKLAARIGGSGLNDHPMALRRAGDIERAVHSARTTLTNSPAGS